MLFWNARARNTHVEATLNHSRPAQAGTYAAAADDGEPDAAWIAVAAPNALPANFLHKLLRLLGGLDLAVKRCHVDVVAETGGGECVLVRVLAAPGAAAAPPPNVNEDGTPMTEEEAIQEAIRRSMQEQ